MISWIQRTFARHTKLVFLFLLVAITIPFIFTIGAAPGIGRAGNKVLERNFFGLNLGNEEQARRVFGDANLSAQLKAGYAALQGAQLQQYALQRAAGLALADELHLPQPGADEIAKFVPTLRAFQDEQGQFDRKRYGDFGDALKAGGQVTTADVNRVLRDDLRLDRLSRIVAGPGYVLPGDVKDQLARSDSTWTVQLATLDYAGFAPSIPVTDDALKKFYDDNLFRYEVPARPRLSLVEFKRDEFVPPVAPTEAQVRAFYDANRSRFPAPPDSNEKKEPALAITPAPADDYAKVRPQVEAALRSAASGRAASKTANDLTLALYERKLAANSTELTEFLSAQHRPAKPVPPFAPDTPPADMSWLGGYAEQIARLGKERFFSDPLATPDGFVVLLWNEDLPGYTPALAEVKDRVTADYREGEKRKLFIARGQALHTQLQAAASTSAAAFATAAAAEKLEVKSYASFTLRQPPQDLPYPAFGALQSLEAGRVSEMIATGDKGYLVFAQEKKLPDITPGNPRYAELEKQLMAFTAAANENAYLGELVEQELKRTEPARP